MTVALDRRGDGIGDVIGAGALRLRAFRARMIGSRCPRARRPPVGSDKRAAGS
jgi:hypothetical protein